MTQEHTPGPFTAHGDFIMAAGSTDTFDGPVLGAIARLLPTRDVDRSGRTWSCLGTKEGNKSLFLASPLMLEALRGIGPILADIGYFEGADPDHVARNSDWLGKKIITSRQAAVNACFDAIAKAEGR